MMNEKPTVYAPMSADIYHASHVNLLEEASKYGSVLVGLNSDEVIFQKKSRLPIVEYSDRKRVLESVDLVSAVHKVENYIEELDNHSHMTIVHGDDWSKESISQVEDMCQQNGGELVLVPYGDGVNSSSIKEKILSLQKSLGRP